MGSGDFNAVSSSRRRTGAKIEHRVSLRLCAFLEGGRIWGAGAFEHGRSPVLSEGRRAGTFSCSKSPLLQVRLALGCLNWRRMKLSCSGGFKKTCSGQLIVRAIPPGFPRYRARIGSTILKKAQIVKHYSEIKLVILLLECGIIQARSGSGQKFAGASHQNCGCAHCLVRWLSSLSGLIPTICREGVETETISRSHSPHGECGFQRPIYNFG